MNKNEKLLAAVNNVLFSQYTGPHLKSDDYNEAMRVLDTLSCI